MSNPRYPARIYAANNGGPHRFWKPELMHADEAAFCCEYISIDAHKAALAKARNDALEEAQAAIRKLKGGA